MLHEAERPRAETPVLAPGRNCWRIVDATRVAFLVDGAAYFAAFAAAVERARHSVLIAGWDIHGDVRLHRDGRPRGLPEELGSFLNAVVGRRRELRVHVLDWDFSMIYALERQPFPLFELGWRTHPRVRFVLDGTHPPGASHHQKIVVVDDAVAFVGGFDLTACRWDTRAHRADDDRRVDPGFAPYAPFHDVQVAVAGDAARVLGDLVRERWRRATGRRLRPPPPGSDPWPPAVEPALRDVPVAIARSEPAWEGAAAVTEVESLWVDAIAAATRSIYLESQYVTSERLRDALAARLAEPDGPEVVIVTPRVCSGWLEETTMGVLRARVLAYLRSADRGGRLRVYVPVVPGAAGSVVDVNVHAKVLIIDERLVRIGSSNASNRSLRLDTECDVALEATTPAIARAIARLRDDLVAEHLGVPRVAVTRAVRRTGSLGAAIETLHHGPRTLAPLLGGISPWMDSLVPDGRLIDWERPVAVEDLVQLILPRRVSRSTRRTLLYGTGTALGVAAAAVLWRTTPLAARVAALAARARDPRTPALAPPLLTVGTFVAGGVAVVPVNALLFGTGLIFPPGRGFIYALVGSMSSAAALYGLGRILPRDAVRLLAGPRLNRAGRRLVRGPRAVARVRLMPIAPFAAVNLVAGSARVRLRDFALGTVAAMAPGVAATGFLARRFLAAHQRPGAGTTLGLVAATALVPLVHAAMHRLLGAPDVPGPRTGDRG